MRNHKSKIRNHKSKGYRPPFRIQFFYIGSQTPVTCIIRSKRYADYLVNRALNSELCSHVVYKDSIRQNVKFFRQTTVGKKPLPDDVVKFLKEQINEEIQIRNKKEERLLGAEV
jgi:hypothetical protein